MTGMASSVSQNSLYRARILSVSASPSSAVSWQVWPSCQRNSVVRRNGRVTFSQRTMLAHWLIEHGQVAPGLDPLGVHVPDDGLRGRPDGQPFLELLLAADRHPGHLGREALDVLGLLLQEALGDEQREIGVDVAGGLDPAVQEPLDVLPDGVAVRADDHHPLHRGVVGQLGLLDDLEVPAGKILGFGRDLADQALVFAHGGLQGGKCSVILDPADRVVNRARGGWPGKRFFTLFITLGGD